jgi:cytidine deaminase
MKKELYQFEFAVYDSSSDLGEEDRLLFEAAQQATANAYAPYSGFNVGAAARLVNGEIIVGGNQENASFPAGLCAEGVVLAAASSRFPGTAITSMAITYYSPAIESNHPISPCGICRQSIQEHTTRTGTPISLIMGGRTGKTYIVNDASSLLPFAFRF